MRILWRSLLALLLIWSLVAIVIIAIQRARPTPQKLMTYVAEHPLSGLDSAKRARIIEHAARLLNGLSFEQRQELKETGTVRNFVKELTSEERLHFINLTVPAGFHQMIKWLNKMESEQRKRLAQRTLTNLRAHRSEAEVFGGDDDIRRMLFQGYSTFEEEADAPVKQDFAPLIEELRKGQPADR